MVAATSVEVLVDRWRDGRHEHVTDRVAEEVPIALTFFGISFVVMLATPSDLEDLAVGFSLSEGIVNSPADIYSVSCTPREDGAINVDVAISNDCFSKLLRRQRNTTGRTGCGLC